MSEQPDLSTLPKRMRYAAQVLREANVRYGSAWSWSPDGLEINADRWEADDRDVVDREAQADTLFRELLIAFSCYPTDSAQMLAGKSARIAAELLIESGWRKAEPGE